MIPQEVEEIDYALEDYAGKWRNRWFLKSGESGWGSDIYTSEEDALEGIRLSWEEVGQNGAMFYCARMEVQLGKKVMWSEMSHAIPMPVKG